MGATGLAGQNGQNGAGTSYRSNPSQPSSFGPSARGARPTVGGSIPSGNPVASGSPSGPSREVGSVNPPSGAAGHSGGVSGHYQPRQRNVSSEQYANRSR